MDFKTNVAGAEASRMRIGDGIQFRDRPTFPQSLDLIRSRGWSVAIHNDYWTEEHRERRTFWLFTHPSGRWIKGEGPTDELAVALCVAEMEKPIEIFRNTTSDVDGWDATAAPTGGDKGKYAPRPDETPRLISTRLDILEKSVTAIQKMINLIADTIRDRA